MARDPPRALVLPLRVARTAAQVAIMTTQPLHNIIGCTNIRLAPIFRQEWVNEASPYRQVGAALLLSVCLQCCSALHAKRRHTVLGQVDEDGRSFNHLGVKIKLCRRSTRLQSRCTANFTVPVETPPPPRSHQVVMKPGT
jgi:hypothetical protein